MATQYSVAARDATLEAFRTLLGASPVLKVFTGSKPANCAAANTGTELVSMTLPATPFAAASAGAMAKAGTWTGTAITSGTAGHYRLYLADGVTCVKQGVIGFTGSPQDLDLSQVSAAIVGGQVVTVGTYALTAGGA